MSPPDIAVVVPSHDRPLRLRWLLNALEDQTLAPARFEVIVAHDSAAPQTEELLRTHSLAAAGVLRHLTFEPGPGPAVKRNAAWRAARAPLVAFTDDDCRPPPDWLERMLAAAARDPAAIVQGTTRPDPDEAVLLHAGPHVRTQRVEPPTPWAQTCNIAYPRALLEEVGGFDERLPLAAGEDADLAVRARRAGSELVAAPDVVMYHSVDVISLRARLRSVWRWRHLAHVIKLHPDLRSHFTLRIFWKRTHASLPLAIAAAALAPSSPLLAALAIPWLVNTWPRYGWSPRGVVRSVSELPSHAVIDAAELAAMVWGTARYRTLCL